MGTRPALRLSSCCSGFHYSPTSGLSCALNPHTCAHVGLGWENTDQIVTQEWHKPRLEVLARGYFCRGCYQGCPSQYTGTCLHCGAASQADSAVATLPVGNPEANKVKNALATLPGTHPSESCRTLSRSWSSICPQQLHYVLPSLAPCCHLAEPVNNSSKACEFPSIGSFSSLLYPDPGYIELSSLRAAAHGLGRDLESQSSPHPALTAARSLRYRVCRSFDGSTGT